MLRLSTLSSIRATFLFRAGLCGLLAALGLSLWPGTVLSAEEEPIRFRVVAVNPSATKTQEVPVKIYLPQEITPRDIVDLGGLSVEYDDTKSAYYVYKEGVSLTPRETKVFEVFVKDVWRIPESEMKSLGEHSSRVLSRLEKSPYYDTARQLADSIAERLQTIGATQTDQTMSRKQHIGAYRLNLQTLAKVKEDLAKLEKFLTFTGGVPVPEMLQESKVKSDAPSTKTTWMLIFMILIFLGLLGGLFFLTWHRKAQEEQNLASFRQGVFQVPGQSVGDGSAHDKKEGKAA